MTERKSEIETEVLPAMWSEGVKLPSLEEAEEAVRQGDQMIKDLATKRRGKLLLWDKEISTVVVGSEEKPDQP